jgi:hypothetical protein
MYKNGIIKTGALLLLVIGINALMLGSALGVEKLTRTSVKSDEIAVFDIDATVMEVNTGEAYVVIAEKRFYVTAYSIDGKKYTTQLTNANGAAIKINALKERQRVLVRGFEVSDDVYIAVLIQMK